LKSYEQYKKQKDNFEKWQDKFDQAKSLEQEKTKELALINRYWAKILESESIAILSIIQTINNNVNLYLESFFDRSINVTLSSFKETKKAVKPGINVNVFYNGESCELSSLSKGQKSRINLAFLLALNNLTTSKLILLDECIGSLDAQLCDDILELLKDQNKFILTIAHQVNTGNFSEILNIE
jgi:DNA repair exonuclease SbcCD ATPase subunit